MSKPVICVLVTLDSKPEATELLLSALRNAGAKPWLIDLSLRPHGQSLSEDQGVSAAGTAGCSWEELRALSRVEATERIMQAGLALARARLEREGFDGMIGLGGANGSTLACGIMRALPLGLPKVMVTPVAATAAVQWYVGASDIAMFPTIGDISVNRVTAAAMSNAANAVVGMAAGRSLHKARAPAPLIGVSSFGNVQPAVDRITMRLEADGYEVIHFHASGPGGRALEALSERGELAGVIDLVTSELTDFLTGGVYSAGESRLIAAGQAGIPQVVVPGCLDFTNLWVGNAPDRYRDRLFVKYNAEILLMRTTAQEFAALGRLMGERLGAAKGPVTMLIPLRGLSGLTPYRMTTLDGEDAGPWPQPEVDRVLIETLEHHFPGDIRKLPLHINDDSFADACVEAMKALLPGHRDE